MQVLRRDLLSSPRHLPDRIEGPVRHPIACGGGECERQRQRHEENRPKLFQTAPDLFLAVSQANYNWVAFQHMPLAREDHECSIRNASRAFRKYSEGFSPKLGAVYCSTPEFLVAIKNRSLWRQNLKKSFLN